jgi:hypothetical protein
VSKTWLAVWGPGWRIDSADLIDGPIDKNYLKDKQDTAVLLDAMFEYPQKVELYCNPLFLVSV